MSGQPASRSPKQLKLYIQIRDLDAIIASEVGTEIARFLMQEAGLINGSLFDDFQNGLTSSKKEL